MWAARGQGPSLLRVDAVLEQGPGPVLLTERVTVSNSSPQLVWLRPVPEPVPFEDAAEELLQAVAAVEPTTPPAEGVRARPFGPSVLTYLMGTTDEQPLRAPPMPEGRTLLVDAVTTFSGRAETSSVTLVTTLPAEGEAFLQRFGVELDPEGRTELARYLNLGWSVVAASVRDPSPNPEQPAVLGPFASPLPKLEYPLLRRAGVDGPSFMVSVLADGPRVPLDFLVVPPGAKTNEPRAVVHYLGPFEPDLGEQRVLTRFELWPGSSKSHSVRLGPPDAAIVAPQLPPAPRDPGGFDLFWVLLLGLTPMVFAPEAWLMWGLQTLARARARAGLPAFGVKLGAVWGLIVAGYWLVAVDGMAKVAAVGPLLFATLQLAIPYAEREPAPVRAEFRRAKTKRRAAEPSQPPGS